MTERLESILIEWADTEGRDTLEELLRQHPELTPEEVGEAVEWVALFLVVCSIQCAGVTLAPGVPLAGRVV